MKIQPDEISSIIKEKISSFKFEIDIAETGKVIQVGDGIAQVHGLNNVMTSEMLEFPHNIKGMALNLEEFNVGCILFGETRYIKEGDIVSIDIGVLIDGFHGDGARTYPVGLVSDIAKKLMEVTRKALEIAIKTAEKAERLGEISHSIQTYVEENGFSVIREYVGHGIGRSIHEQPQIPNYGEKRAGPKLRPGMVLAIEPMVSSGDWRTETLKDGWTAITLDHSLSAHFEDTVALTENGVQVLTRSNRGEKNTKREE